MNSPAPAAISAIGRDVLANVGFPDQMPAAFKGAEIIETHISVVLLAEKFVLKIKKPVLFHFVDQRDQSIRRQIAKKEILLNRRLSDELYLGIVELPFRNPQSWQEEVHVSDFEPVDRGEPAVVMRRVDENQFLSALLEEDRVEIETHIRPLAERLVTFHKQNSLAYAEAGDPRGIAGEIGQNLKELQNRRELLPGGSELLLEHLERYLVQVADENAERAARRSRNGLIVDGHGDLRTEHVIYRGSTVEALDCLEFSDALRRVDVLNDLAFLLMDLEFRNRGDLAASLEEEYFKRFPGAADEVLLPFYRIYRATVRAKVAALKAEQEGASLSEEAGRYLALAGRYGLSLSPPLLFITCGVMGSGKSSLARTVQQFTSGVMLRTDEIRQCLFPIDPTDKNLAFGEGKYSEEARMETYRAMFARAERLLSRGNIVILDAAFSAKTLRSAAYLLAEKLRAPMVILQLTAAEDVLRERLKRRTQAGDDASDGRTELLSEHLRSFEAPSEAEAAALYRFDEQAQTNLPEAVFRALADLAPRFSRAA